MLLPIKPTHDGVLIDIVDRSVTLKDLGGGKVLHLLSDDSFEGPHNTVSHSHPGIRPRWARVLAVGPDVHDSDVKVGDLVLCDTLKWSRKFPLGRDGQEVVYMWRIGVNDILMINTDASATEYLANFEAKFARLKLTIGHL